MGPYECYCPSCGTMLGYSKGPAAKTAQRQAEVYNNLIFHLHNHRKCLVAWSRALNKNMKPDFEIPNWVKELDEKNGEQIHSMSDNLERLKRKSHFSVHGKRKLRIMFDRWGNEFTEVTGAKYNPYLIPVCNFVQ